MPLLIYEARCAFIAGRNIAENILLAHEHIRNFNKKGIKKKLYQS